MCGCRRIFYSHFDRNTNYSKLLREHLREVADSMVRIYANHKQVIKKIPIDDEFLYYVGIAHDFGKYTSYFQKWLLEKQKDSKNRHWHSFIGSIFAAWLCKKLDSWRYLPLVAYEVVLHHIGDLKNFDDDLKKENEHLNIAKEQIQDIKQRKSIVEKEYGFCISEFFEEWEQTYEDLRELKYCLLEQLSTDDPDRITAYFSILYTFSLLIDSDKKSAACVQNEGRKNLLSDLVDNYIIKYKGWHNPQDDINKKRTKLYNNAIDNINNIPDTNKILAIIAPTGLGKTLINLSVAIKLRNKSDPKPRIIYSLPFTSIIDQTYNTIDEILKVNLGKVYQENKEQYLLKHHHLSNITYKVDDEEKPPAESLLLIESWNSEIIVTTFVQLLHSIIAFKNTFIKKFHNIVNSIIILDEIQTIDISYWKVIREILLKITELFNCKIIFSTATKPLIFKEGEYHEIISDYKNYFQDEQLNRTKLNYSPKNNKMNIKEFVNYFNERFDPTKNSYLIIVNTIKSSIEIYEAIRKKYEGQYDICYLSTNIIPLQREVRIQKIKNAIKNKKKIIVISTQVVEAGVDLDFEKVYRDIAPLDSLIQACGRCNRNKKSSMEVVEVVCLIDDKGRELGKNIYGSTLINISKGILSEQTQAQEREFINLMEKYYYKIADNKSTEKSDDTLKAIQELVFFSNREKVKSIAKKFKVIEEMPNYIDVFVQVSKSAKTIFEIFINNVFKEKDFKKRFLNYLQIRNKFRRYIISIPSIPEKYIIGIDTKTFPTIPYDQLDCFYLKNSYGFKRVDNDQYLAF